MTAALLLILGALLVNYDSTPGYWYDASGGLHSDDNSGADKAHPVAETWTCRLIYPAVDAGVPQPGRGGHEHQNSCTAFV